MKQDVHEIKSIHKATQAAANEYSKALDKFPTFPVDPFAGYTVLAEECGEVAKSVIDYKFGKATKADILEEIAQTAAMCYRLYQAVYDWLPTTSTEDE